MNCVNHTDKEATGVCVYCGKFFCEACLVEVEGKNYCKSCVTKAFTEQKQQANSAQTININNVANSTTMAMAHSYGNQMISPKSRLVSLLLCIFLGGLGIHRFYAGKIGSGILYLLTFGLFGFGILYDFIIILLGSFRDQYGMSIKNWDIYLRNESRPI